MRKSLLIAVDFDGTIVEDAYPKIGKPKPFAIETIKMLKLKNISLEQQSDSDSQTYYVIHPVLKHVAIKKGMQICGLE